MNDTGPVKLPGLPPVQTGNPALDRWIQAASERLEVREGTRGNPYERVVLQRDLKTLGLDGVAGQGWATAANADGGIMVQAPGGGFARVSVDAFTNSLRRSRLYQSLTKTLDDPGRFDDVPEVVRAIVLKSLADEAAERGADIRRVEAKLQGSIESLAYTVDTVTAAVEGSAAGVRETTYASATANRATAGRILQIQSRLNNFTPTGEPGIASIEQVFKTIADRATGLESEYTLKTQVTAGGVRALASIGVSATIDPAGNADSAVYVLANKFAIITPADVVSDPKNPPLDRVPFGVDASGIYINGKVRINAAGATIESVGRSIVLTASSSVFKVSAAGAASPSAITLQATLGGGLTGTPTFSVIDGAASLSGSGTSRTLSYSSMGSDRVTLRASVTMDGQPYSNDLTLYKAYDGQSGVPGSTGPTGGTGANGQAGQRGSVIRYGSGSWSDAAANSLVPDGVPVLGDTVTLSTSTSATTKFWPGYGTAWIDTGVVLDGNLLVRGTATAGTVSTNKIFIRPSLFSGPETLDFELGYVERTYYIADGIGTPIFTTACSPPTTSCIVSVVLIAGDTTQITIRVHVLDMATGLLYRGRMENFKIAVF